MFEGWQCCHVLYFPWSFSPALPKVRNSSESEQHFRASTDMTLSQELPTDPALRSQRGKDAQVPMNSAPSASVHTEYSMISLLLKPVLLTCFAFWVWRYRPPPGPSLLSRFQALTPLQGAMQNGLVALLPNNTSMKLNSWPQPCQQRKYRPPTPLSMIYNPFYQAVVTKIIMQRMLEVINGFKTLQTWLGWAKAQIIYSTLYLK